MSRPELHHFIGLAGTDPDDLRVVITVSDISTSHAKRKVQNHLETRDEPYRFVGRRLYPIQPPEVVQAREAARYQAREAARRAESLADKKRNGIG